MPQEKGLQSAACDRRNTCVNLVLCFKRLQLLTEKLYMSTHYARYCSLALVKEIESPENPGALEKRVALVPSDVGRLVKSGIKVYVEYGAGDGVGFSDDEYLKHHAIMQTADQIYKDKALIIKFKGPALSSIKEMKEGTTLLCMAHFQSYPKRAALLQDRRINVIAMEDIYKSPKQESDPRIIGRLAMKEALTPFIDNHSIGQLHVRIIGWSERLRGAINRCGNRSPHSMQVIQPTTPYEELDARGPRSLYFYDSKDFNDPHNILPKLQNEAPHLYDLNEYWRQQGQPANALFFMIAAKKLLIPVRHLTCFFEVVTSSRLQ